MNSVRDASFWPSTIRRKIWLAVLAVLTVTSLVDATSSTEVIRVTVGALLFYLVPVGVWELFISGSRVHTLIVDMGSEWE